MLSSVIFSCLVCATAFSPGGGVPAPAARASRPLASWTLGDWSAAAATLPCQDEDGAEFASLAEAEAAYPNGGYLLTVTAYDICGNHGSAATHLIVRN